MSRELRGALIYLALVFAAGIVLGALREFLLVPTIGRLPAVLAEMPLMLGWAWVAAGIALTRARVPPGPGRARVGLAALAGLLALEFTLGAALRGWDARAWLADFLSAPGLVALAGYLVFAALPALQRQP